MKTLKEGKQYDLYTEDKISCNRSLIFVKLTDSALRSIEEFVELKKDAKCKPTIQFQNNNGVITLPIKGSNQTYEFALSNVEADGPQGSFECFQQNNNSFLESLGCMHMKMHILANEDSYEKTRVKITAAEQEQKKFCTKEIKSNNKLLVRKVNRKRPGLKNSSEKFQSSVTKPEPKKLSLKTKAISPVTSIHHPIRERVIHILAAKPYKKAELLLRLKREGVSDKDKNQIDDILAEVAKLKGNNLILEEHVWTEINDDWEFYSKAELQSIKKKKEQFLKPKDVNESADLSKHSVNQKNVPSALDTKSLSSKKQKISFISAQNNIINQNESCSPNNNTLTNGSTIHPTKKLSHFHDLNDSLKNFSLKKHSPLFNHKEKLLEKDDNHLDSDVTLQASSVHQDLQNLEINGKNEEGIVMESSNLYDRIKDENKTTNLITGNAEPTKSIKMSKVQEKQSNKSSDTTIIDSEDIYVKNKLKHYKQVLSDYASARKNFYKKGNKNGDNSAEISPVLKTEPKINSPEVSEFNLPEIPEFNFPEIQLKYTKVESLEQRDQYEKDFNDDYEEYMKLQAEMSQISGKFSTMYDIIYKFSQGSSAYKTVEGLMIKEYKKIIDNGYIDRKKRFEFLKTKLALIRELVITYDADAKM